MKLFQYSLIQYICIQEGGEGWLGFPDLWSGQKPWWRLYLTPVVNFGEVRRAQLAISTLFTSSLVPLGSFKVCSDAKERVGCGKATWSYRTYSSLVKLQPRFLSLQWKTCLRAELQPWCLSLQWMTCPWAEHIMMMMIFRIQQSKWSQKHTICMLISIQYYLLLTEQVFNS